LPVCSTKTARCPGPAGRRARPAARPESSPTSARATPAGRFPLLRAFYRADRLAAPATALPLAALAASDGWVDDPRDPRYNTQVTLPYPASHERLWRDDALYDLIVVIGYNTGPVVPGKGSAIFLHCARPDFSPTEGCIAVARDALASLLGLLGPGSTITIRA